MVGNEVEIHDFSGVNYFYATEMRCLSSNKMIISKEIVTKEN